MVIYICVYVCVYIYIYVCVYIYIYVCVCVYIYEYISRYLYILMYYLLISYLYTLHSIVNYMCIIFYIFVLSACILFAWVVVLSLKNKLNYFICRFDDAHEIYSICWGGRRVFYSCVIISVVKAGHANVWLYYYNICMCFFCNKLPCTILSRPLKKKIKIGWCLKYFDFGFLLEHFFKHKTPHISPIVLSRAPTFLKNLGG